jgi:hypothetical protein
MLSPPVYYTILALVCLFALWRGRTDERAAASICILATLASNIVYEPTRSSYAGVEVGVFMVDTLTFVGFTLIALRSERFWPLWLAGLQLTTVFSHLLKAIQLDLMPQAYAAAARFWVYPIFMIIVVGTWRASRRRMSERRQAALA